jgi:tetratricopeptide (TPR) repeat protein
LLDELKIRAQRLEGYAAQDPANVELLCDLAQTYHQAGEHERALAVLDRAEHAGGQPSRFAALRARLLMALGRWQEAATLLEGELAAAPDSAALLANLGYARWAAGEAASALQPLERAAELDAGSADIRYQFALALEETGDPTAASQMLQEAIARDSRHARALAMLARLALDAGDLAGATELAGRCTAADPQGAAGWQLRGQVALFHMDAAAASKYLRQALDLDPADVDTCVSLAQASMMQGRVRHARSLLNEAVERDATHDAAWCMLGWACAAENDAAAAGVAFERALAVTPDHPDALAGQACLHLSEGRREEALAAAQRALVVDAQHTVANLVVARACELDGRAPEARELLDGVLASTPFGPMGSTVAQMLRDRGTSSAARKMQRRFARAGIPKP